MQDEYMKKRIVMRKFIIAALFSVLFVCKSFAGEFGIWMGYTGFKMDDVNNALKTAAGPAGAVTEVNNGSLYAFDLLFDVAPQLLIGPRIEGLSANRGEASRVIDFLDATYVKQDVSLVPVMIGAKYIIKDLGRGVELNGKLFTGPGFGYSRTEAVTFAGGFVTENDAEYSGTGWVTEPMLGMNFMMTPFSDLALDLGYRFADMGTMGGPVKVDFSGVFFNLGINYRFGYIYE
jgi:hypothetical protein